MKRSPLLILSLGFLIGPAARARADVVTFPNGVKMEGILTTTEYGTTELQVSEDGSVVLDTATVVSIRKQSAAENSRLKSKWTDQGLQTSRNEKEQRKFAETQRAKGLIPYQGEWITPAEFDRRLALDELDVQRDRAAHPSIQQVIVEVEAPSPTYYVGYSSLYYREPRQRKLDYADSGPLRRINGTSSSGNFIRPSEFARPSAHPNARYFDPSTGLYR